jgi:cytoskeletal protein CcmA (bactofilin family)
MGDTTVIAHHTTVKGEFHFSNAAIVAGKLEGGIISEESLEVTPEGEIRGDIQGVLVDIQGTVNGNIVATRACRLGATARVNGEIRAANLSFADGAFFAGQVFVGSETGDALVQDETDNISAAQAVAGSINRLQTLAQEVEEVAASAKPEPTVRVLSQNVQQSMHRTPKIIKAR